MSAPDTPAVTPAPPNVGRELNLQHITDVRRRLLAVVADLARRAEVHDASKLVAPEAEAFEAGAVKLHDLTYTEPEYQKDSLEKLGAALKAHWAANDHHPEHFANGVQGMNLIQLLELACDWHAACRRHRNGDPYISVAFNQHRFEYSDDLKCILDNTMRFLDGVTGDERTGTVQTLLPLQDIQT